MSAVDGIELLFGEILAHLLEESRHVQSLDGVRLEDSVLDGFDLLAVGPEFRRIVRRNALSREFVRGFEPDAEDDGNLVALGDISERNGGIALHFQVLRRRFAALRIRLLVRTVDTAYERVLARAAFQILHGNRSRSGDRLDEFRGDLAVGHLLCLEARLAVTQTAREDRIAELPGVLGEGGADFDDSVRGFAFGEGHRVVVNPGSGKHDPLQAVGVGVEEFTGIFAFARFEHDTLRREGNHAVLERAILSGRLVHGEILRRLRCDVPLAHLGKEGQAG